MYANCLIVALIQKIKNPRIKLYFIKSKANFHGNFHVMWKNQYNQNFHFTRDKGYNVRCEWLFRGHIEELYPGTIEKLKGCAT